MEAVDPKHNSSIFASIVNRTHLPFKKHIHLCESLPICSFKEGRKMIDVRGTVSAWGQSVNEECGVT